MADPRDDLKIEWDGTSYLFNPFDANRQQMKVMKATTGLNFNPMLEAVAEGDPDCIAALIWLMKTRAGEAVDIESINPQPMRFMEAYGDAVQKAVETSGEAPAAEAADPS